MAYQFHNNPLDTYLEQMREYIRIEYELYKKLSGVKGDWRNRIIILENVKNVQIKIKQLKKYQLAPRNYDIFLSTKDRLSIEFDNKHPEPKNNHQCNHKHTEVRIKKFKNDTLHIWEQCETCGRKTGSRVKSDHPDWEKLPKYDDTLAREWNAEYRNWKKMRHEYISGYLELNDGMPEFNWDAFNHEFESKNPKPRSPEECTHRNKQLTIRTYKNNNPGPAVVEQCLDCGKHLKSMPKKSVENMHALPVFDIQLESEIRKLLSRWCTKRMEEISRAQEEFHEEVARKIVAGELTTNDTSKFGTYYDSPEWQATRKRILQRDEHECQACNNPAECIHHIIYERLGCENDLDLISLCEDCHTNIHLQQNQYPYRYRLTPLEIRNLKQV